MLGILDDLTFRNKIGPRTSSLSAPASRSTSPSPLSRTARTLTNPSSHSRPPSPASNTSSRKSSFGEAQKCTSEIVFRVNVEWKNERSKESSRRSEKPRRTSVQPQPSNNSERSERGRTRRSNQSVQATSTPSAPSSLSTFSSSPPSNARTPRKESTRLRPSKDGGGSSKFDESPQTTRS